MASSLEGYKNKMVHVVTGDGRSFVGTLKESAVNSGTMDQLSRHCVQVLSRGTLADIEGMAEAIGEAADTTLIEYQKHLLLPLLKRLQSGTRSEKADSLLLDTLTSILERIAGQLRDAELLYNILLTLLTFYCSPEGGFQRHVSEDLQLALTRILYAVFTRTDDAIIVEIYTEKKYQVVVAPLIKALVDLVGHRSKELKLGAIRALRASCSNSQLELVNTVCNFLPGIVMCLLHEVTTFSDKSHRVFNAALEALTDSVCLVMSDDVQLDNEFYKKATPNLAVCLGTLKSVCCPPHFSECESACRYFASEILARCSYHLDGVIFLCLDILLTLEDPRDISLERFASLMKCAENVSMQQKFLEFFQALFVRMPRISAVGLDPEKIALIRQLHGLLRICPDAIGKVIENELSRKRFFTSLFHLVAFEYTALRISPAERCSADPVVNLHRQTKALNEVGISELRGLCQTFGKHIDISSFRDWLLESVNSSRKSAEAALIFSFIAEGLSLPADGGEDLIEYVIEVSPSDDDECTSTILYKVFLSMLLRQLISKVRPVTVNVLPFLLAGQESQVDVCMASAEKALFELPNAMGFTNLEDLLIEKADDILLSFEELLVDDPLLFHHACRGLLGYLPEQAVELYDPLFVTLINHLPVGDTVETLTTMHHVIKCLETRYPRQRRQVDTTMKDSLQDLAIRLLRERQEARAAEDRIDKESAEVFDPADMLNATKDEEDNGRYSVGDKQPVELPVAVRVCRDTLDACVNMQSGSLFVHTKAFEIIADGIVFIEAYEDELLPMVHIIWEALVHRLRSSDNFALSTKALTVLSTLCRTSRTFVRERIVAELWPRFCSFLREQCNVSSKTPFREYRHLSVYRYHLALLESLGEYVTQLELREEHLSPILTVVLPYLMDCQQPAEISRRATNTVKQMSLVSPECVRYCVRKAVLDSRSDGCSWCDVRLREQPDPARALQEFPNLAAVWV